MERYLCRRLQQQWLVLCVCVRALVIYFFTLVFPDGCAKSIPFAALNPIFGEKELSFWDAFIWCFSSFPVICPTLWPVTWCSVLASIRFLWNVSLFFSSTRFFGKLLLITQIWGWSLLAVWYGLLSVSALLVEGFHDSHSYHSQVYVFKPTRGSAGFQGRIILCFNGYFVLPWMRSLLTVRDPALSDLLLVSIFVAFRRGCQQLNHSHWFVPRNEAHASVGTCYFFLFRMCVCVSELTCTATRFVWLTHEAVPTHLDTWSYDRC